MGPVLVVHIPSGAKNMAWRTSRIVLPAALAVVALGISLAASQPQENTNKTAELLQIPHTTRPVLLDCSSESNASWKGVPRVTLSRESGTVMRANFKRPLALEFLSSDPNAVVTKVPSKIEGKLDSFRAQYAFQWDENRLYGYVVIEEQDVNSGHHKISERAFRRSPYAVALDDMFYSTAVVEIGAPSWYHWMTEMHVDVRAPNAKPLRSMFFGRTNDEEDFRVLSGEGIACPGEGGWVAKFAVAWLPFGDWQPKSGTTANLKLIAPLPRSHEGYVLVSVVPFVLTN
ncbi:MAG TPA: hypothetical protein VFL79_13925 [Terriglobia bacterium]|nr:hypothetical protein [Terriglobia bacterium]